MFNYQTKVSIILDLISQHSMSKGVKIFGAGVEPVLLFFNVKNIFLREKNQKSARENKELPLKKTKSYR